MSPRPAFGPPRIELRGLDLNQHFDVPGPGPGRSGDRRRILSLEQESEIDGDPPLTAVAGTDHSVTTSFSFSFALLAHPGRGAWWPGSSEGYPNR
jgi:hypothetical protein